MASRLKANNAIDAAAHPGWAAPPRLFSGRCKAQSLSHGQGLSPHACLWPGALVAGRPGGPGGGLAPSLRRVATRRLPAGPLGSGPGAPAGATRSSSSQSTCWRSPPPCRKAFAQFITLCSASHLAETRLYFLSGAGHIACQDVGLFEAFSGPWPPSATFDKLL
jgi:hypothetical protein